MGTKLYRSEKNKILGGVAGGLGEYFGIDPLFIRIIFILLAFFHGAGILIYLILWVILPAESNVGKNTESVKHNLHDLKTTAESKKTTLGLIVIIIGLIFLMDNLGINLDIGRFWPVILIILGIVFLIR